MMARQRVDVKLEGAAGILVLISRAMPDLRDHVRHEQDRIDSWSAGAPEVSVTSSSDTSTTEAAALCRWKLQLALDKIEADNRALHTIITQAWLDIQALAGYRAPDAAEFCNRKIDPTCEQLASPHHDPHRGGELVDGLCDQCWIAACPVCRARPAMSRRKVTVDGRLVDGCEACERREQRRIGRITTVDGERVRVASVAIGGDLD